MSWITYQSHTWNSTLQQKRAIELDHLISLSLVFFWIARPCFDLTKGFSYKPDFLVVTYDQKASFGFHAEDVKVRITTGFRAAKKLWIAHAPIPLHVLTRSDKNWKTEIVRPWKLD